MYASGVTLDNQKIFALDCRGILVAFQKITVAITLRLFVKMGLDTPKSISDKTGIL
jgi:hypothetical protein